MDPITATGGATGEPEPAADGSQINADDILKSLDAPAQPPAAPAPTALDEEFVKKLSSLKPGDLPESVRKAWQPELEAPFLSMYNKKTTEWDNERKQFQGIIDRLSNRPPGSPEPTVDQKEEIRKRLADGDFGAAEQLLDRMFQERVAPQMAEIARNNAIMTAAKMMPHLAKYDGAISQAITADPELSMMSAIGNHRFAPQVMAGLAWREHALAMEKENATLKSQIDDKVRRAIDETQKRIRALPSSTSRAGAAPSRPSSGESSSLRQSLEEAYAEQTGG